MLVIGIIVEQTSVNERVTAVEFIYEIG